MAKTVLQFQLLDLERIEQIKELLNEILDTLEALRLSGVDDENRGHEIIEAEKERQGFINRFADIIES